MPQPIFCAIGSNLSATVPASFNLFRGVLLLILLLKYLKHALYHLLHISQLKRHQLMATKSSNPIQDTTGDINFNPIAHGHIVLHWSKNGGTNPRRFAISLPLVIVLRSTRLCPNRMPFHDQLSCSFLNRLFNQFLDLVYGRILNQHIPAACASMLLTFI